MLERFADLEFWQEFLSYKIEHALLNSDEEAELRAFIDERRYIPFAQSLADGSYRFSCPERKEISKLGSAKKRVVYTFSGDESIVLKLLAYTLYRYDSAFSSNCYAFRQHIGPHRAFTDIAFHPGIDAMWGFKTDISNYFNSIDISRLEPILCDVINDDPPLLHLLLELLNDERCLWQGEVIREKKGVMPGTPISAFLANLYLREMDYYFEEHGICYARYSDDIIIFDTREALESHREMCHGFIERVGLRINPEKEQLIAPGESWSFLGFQYHAGKIDISRVTVKKLMGKARRTARSIRRWMLKKDAEPQRALAAFNRKFNRKFFSADSGRELSWSRWFFPLITTADTLHTIDLYMQDCQRYIVTGKYNKSCREKVPYELMKECGYRPLVTAYYDHSSE